MKRTITILLFSLAVFTIQAQTNSCNCCTDKHSEFDFWIGDWNVTNPDGSKAGTNVISKSQNNCLLQENWKSANGKITGTSNNFYNYQAKQWEQIWVDNVGGSLHLKGNRDGNKMIMRTDDLKNKKGETFYHRVTWTLKKDGSVHQYWETITNNKDITVAFDGLYKRISE